jgi:uncharacterized protein
VKTITWDQGMWLNKPESLKIVGTSFYVTAKPESDFWRHTSYGFVHETAHVLLNDFPNNCAIEVSFILDYRGTFDQAGLIVYADEKRWTKAGIEFSDGAPQLGAVVTDQKSDWSVAPVPEWFGKEVTIRASRSGDALTIRARCAGPWRLVRLAPLNEALHWRAGLHLASPLQEGLTVQFTRWESGEADETLHEDFS